ncbi:MAG: hypothetical protein JST31_03950 [Actinobacteria bacterium]|nr:hypothetical protein [Actinomycetota bacterium]
MKRLALFACFCLALAALAAGCGGSGGSSSGGGEFSAEANAACTTANARVAALPRPEGEAQLLPYVEKTEAIVVGLEREVTALGGSGDAIKAYLAGLEESAQVLNKMSNAARSHNLGAVGELASQLAEIGLARLASAAGLGACAKAPAVQP